MKNLVLFLGCLALMVPELGFAGNSRKAGGKTGADTARQKAAQTNKQVIEAGKLRLTGDEYIKAAVDAASAGAAATKGPNQKVDGVDVTKANSTAKFAFPLGGPASKQTLTRQQTGTAKSVNDALKELRDGKGKRAYLKDNKGDAEFFKHVEDIMKKLRSNTNDAYVKEVRIMLEEMILSVKEKRNAGECIGGSCVALIGPTLVNAKIDMVKELAQLDTMIDDLGRVGLEGAANAYMFMADRIAFHMAAPRNLGRDAAIKEAGKDTKKWMIGLVKEDGFQNLCKGGGKGNKAVGGLANHSSVSAAASRRRPKKKDTACLNPWMRAALGC